MSTETITRCQALFEQYHQYCEQEEIAKALTCLNQAEALLTQPWSNDFGWQKSALTSLVMQRVYRYGYELENPDAALDEVEKYWPLSSADHDFFTQVSIWALQQKRWRLLAKVLLRSLMSMSCDDAWPLVQAYQEFYPTVAADEAYLPAALVCQRFYFANAQQLHNGELSELQLDGLNQQSIEVYQQAISNFPQHFVGYYFLASHYFDQRDFAAALQCLEQALPLEKDILELGSLYWRKYLVAYIHVHGELPALCELTPAAADDYYNDGVRLSDVIEAAGLYNDELALQWRLAFYQRSYDSYYRYFYSNEAVDIGPGGAEPEHMMAICANNLGILLTHVGEYQAAIDVHQLGYNLSPFWEQLDSLVTALDRAEQPSLLLQVIDTYLHDFGDELPFSEWIYLKGQQIGAYHLLGREGEAKQWIERSSEEFHRFIEENRAELSADDLDHLNRRFSYVDSYRQQLLYHTSTAELEQMFARCPEDVGLRRGLIDAYHREHQSDKVLPLVQSYLPLVEDWGQPHRMIAGYRYLAFAAHYLKDYQLSYDYWQLKSELLTQVDPNDWTWRLLAVHGLIINSYNLQHNELFCQHLQQFDQMLLDSGAALGVNEIQVLELAVRRLVEIKQPEQAQLYLQRLGQLPSQQALFDELTLWYQREQKRSKGFFSRWFS